jgi:uncharacterized repeat protein (TIGR01451 family)
MSNSIQELTGRSVHSSTRSRFRLYLASLGAVALVSALVMITSPADRVQATPALPGFHAPVSLPNSNGGNEPSLAISNSGIRYPSWQGPGEFARSFDGVNFVNLGQPDPDANGDVANQVSYSGALYNVQICGIGTPTGLHSCLYRSLDGGNTWETRNILADNHPGASDRPWIDVYPKGNTTPTATDPDHDTVYLEFHTFSPDDLVYVTKSTDGGATFGAPIPVEQDTNALDSTCNTVPGGIIVDQSNGNVYALWLSGDDVVQNQATACNYSQIGPFPKAWVSTSTDGGTTWTPSLAFHGAFDPTTNIGDNASKIFATLAQDTSGQVHVGLSVRHNDDPRAFFLDCQTDPNCLEEPNPTDFYIMTSPDHGAHWTLPFKVNQTTGSFFFPWVTAGSAGIVQAAYYSSDTLRPNDPKSVWYVGTSRVTGAIAQYTSGPNATYVSPGPQATPEILLDPNRVHGNGSTGGGICTFGLSCEVVPGSNRNLGDVFETHLDPAGGVNVSWTSDNGGNKIGYACQDSGPSAFAGAPDLNGCYGPTDMSITKTDSPDPVGRGANLTYHFTVANNGAPTDPTNRTTSNVKLTDVLPAGVTLVSATASDGTCTGTTTVTCNLGIFPSARAETVDIVVNVGTAASPITNTATVSNAPREVLGPATYAPDPDTSNNTATATTTIVGCPGFETDTRTQVVGTAGSDTLVGTSGDDILCGLGGNDTLRGLAGNDLLLGGDNKDTLLGGAGNDAFNGGTGVDTVSFSDGPVASGVTANLATGTSTNTQLGNDTFVAVSPGGCSTVENLTGSGFNDSLTGDACANTLYGADGNDTLNGGGGGDLLQGAGAADSLSGGDGTDLMEPGTGDDLSADGGAGFDTLAYVDITTGGVGINVATATSTGTATGGAGTDHFTPSTIEAYYGTAQADTLTGDTGANLLYGLGGADAISGGGGNDTMGGGAGADSIDGGGGVDSSTYYTAPGAATVNLSTGTASNDGTGSADSLISVENVLGSNAGGDSITGSAASNSLYGFGGNDSLSGLAGNDYLDGGAGTDTLNGGNGTDRCLNGEGTLTGCESTTAPLSGSSVGTSIVSVVRAEARTLRQLGQAGFRSEYSGTVLAGRR